MAEKFDPRANLGPLVNQVYVAQLCGLDERVWEEFRSHAENVAVPVELTIAAAGDDPRSQSRAGAQLSALGERLLHCST